MLRHLGEHHAADKIHDGLEKVYRTKDKRTRDVGGKAGTSEFADSIIQFMETSTDVPGQPNLLTHKFMNASQATGFRPKAVWLLIAAIALAAPASSQNLKVTLLGTGAPRPVMERFGPSILVEAGKEKLLFDCGRGATMRLYQLKVAIRRPQRPVSDPPALRSHCRNF